jgi:hypothetical protein
MALGVAQTTTYTYVGAASSVTRTFSSNTTTGYSIIAIADSYDGSGAGVHTITDNGTGTRWAQVVDKVSGSSEERVSHHIGSGYTGKASHIVTFTPGAPPTDLGFVTVEVSGANITAAGAANSGTGTSSSFATGAVNPTGSDILYIASFVTSVSGTFGLTWTGNVSLGSQTYEGAAYLLSSGNQSPTFTSSASGEWVADISTYREAQIGLVGNGTATSGQGTGGTYNPALPSGVAAGDLLLLAVYWGDASGSVATPSGWTQRRLEVDAGGDGDMIGALFYRIATGSGDAPQVVLSGGASSTACYVMQTAAFRSTIGFLSNPWDTSGTLSGTGTIQNVGPISGITATDAESCVLVFGAKFDNWTSIDTLAQNGLAFFEIGEPYETVGDDGGLMWDYAITGTVAVTDKTFVVTGGATASWFGFMDSFKPGAPAATRKWLFGAR